MKIDEGDVIRMPVNVLPATVIVPGVQGPVIAMASSKLRDSIERALAGVEAGHGNARLEIDGGGAGVGIAWRSDDGVWRACLIAKYDWKTKQPEFAAAVTASW